MNQDKKILYLTSFLSLALLLPIFFVGAGHGRIITAGLLALIAVASCTLIKKRGALSIQKKEVLMLVTLIAVIYVVLREMTGIYFKFSKNPYFVNLEIICKYVIPSVVIILSSEIIRRVLLQQKNRFVDVISFLICTLSEVLMFADLSYVTNFNRVMDIVGLSLFPAISANIYYHYISKRYGMISNIVFRLITTLYVYFVPTVTSMSDSLTSCVKIILPIIMLTLVSAMFERKKKNAVKKGKKIGAVSVVLTVATVILIAMLISCQFRFGALVIATDSMTGEINKGDMIIYERYENQKIEEGQVIVFLQDEYQIVHRVVKIENINGEIRYYTKGDANEDPDYGYRTAKDIVGLTDMKVAYIGFPTLWLRELQESSN